MSTYLTLHNLAPVLWIRRGPIDTKDWTVVQGLSTELFITPLNQTQTKHLCCNCNPDHLAQQM